MLGVALAVTFVCRRVNETFHAGEMPGVGLGGLTNYVKSFLLVDNLTSPGVVLGQTWTLKIEILFYLATLVLLGYSRRSPLRATWVMLGMWVVVNLVLFSRPGIRETMLYPVYVGFLIVGRTLYLAHAQKISRAEGMTLALTTGTFFVLIYSSVFPGELLRELNPNAASMALALVAFIALMQAPIRRLPGPVRFLGDISYSLYLLHIPVGMLVLNVAHKMGTHHTAAFLAATAASIAASYVGYRLVEVPAQRLARRLSPKRRHLRAAAPTGSTAS
jgi:peptidoglycan/LPS O-acetylase OafA/YrhL